jgi:thiol-disulfide isomerase/thioredoxin
MPEINVLLITQPDCGHCESAKLVLEKLAKEFPLAVRIVGLDTDEGGALADRGGILFPPGLFLDGEPFSYGRPSERKLRKTLEQRFARA